MNLTEPNKTDRSAHAPLKRTEVREILKRHPGSISTIADELGVTTTTVSMWLRGKTTSARIETACHKRAHEFLQQEKARSAA